MVLTIGGLTLPVPCLLAPMAGVSDLPFRLVTRRFGAPLAFTEMIDAKALGRNDRRTIEMLRSTPEDQPLGIQLLANDADHLARAIDALGSHGFDLIDLNAACPAAKITRGGKGAALLKDPVTLGKLLGTMVSRSGLPVTAKIRTGWDSDSINARDIALRAEDAGICALFIHGRTRSQGYAGNVDYKTIRAVKEALRIPVIASGDNLSAPLAARMFEETGCDGVAVARGALGNPWIFREMVHFFSHGSFAEKPGIDERVAVMRDHLDLSVGHYGEQRGVGSFHKFFIWYTRGLRGMKALRDRAFRTATQQELEEIIDAVASQDAGDIGAALSAGRADFLGEQEREGAPREGV